MSRPVAARPATRVVEVELAGEFAGWWARARADFPASLLADLGAGDPGRVVAVLEAIVLEHNLPTSDGSLASSIGAVDPYDGLLAIGRGIFEAIAKLPNRQRPAS